MVSKSIRDALEYVAKHPEPTLDPIDTPVWELVARSLYDIANNPQPKIRGGLARATRAQRMILDRKVGRRRTGTHPAQKEQTSIAFKDLTQGRIERE